MVSIPLSLHVKPVFCIFLFLLMSAVCVTASADSAGNGEGGTPPGAGTLTDPAILTIGTSYTGSIQAAGTVHYTFTTGNRAFTHAISMGSLNSNYLWTLYSDAGYTNLVDACSGYGYAFSCATDQLNAQTTYYLKVNEMSVASDTYHIKVDVNIGSEGAPGAPVSLTVGTPHVGAVKKKGGVNGASYYTFTTNASDNHTISLSGATTDIKWELYKGDYEYDGVNECDEVWDVGNESCSTSILDANTVYYLTVENAGSVGTFFTVNVTEGGSPPPIGSDEGTTQNPVVVNVGQAHIGTVAAGGTSYYRFTTGTTVATYLIRLARVSAKYEISVYRDAEFTDRIEQCYRLGPTYYSDYKCRITYLDANTPYYFAVKNYSDVGDTLSITVLEDMPRSPDSEGTPISPVDLTVGSLHAGKVGAWERSYYKFTATEAKPYRISLIGGSRDIYWISHYNWDDIYPESVCSTYGTGNESCVTGRFDVGQTVYVYVGNEDEFNADTFNIIVEVEDGQGEGTPTTPIELTPGMIHSGSVIPDYGSYYQFTTGSEPMLYTIALTLLGADANWDIRKVGDYNPFYSCGRYIDTSDEVCTPPPLAPNTTYRVDVRAHGGQLTSYNLLIGVGVPPATLVLGQPYSETTDGNTTKKYYRFTTGPEAASPYTVSIVNAANNVGWLLYTDPLFPSGQYIHVCDHASTGPYDESCTITNLAPNTTYHLNAFVSKYYGDTATYDIVVNQGGGSEGGANTPIVLSLPASHTGTVADNGYSYYQFTTGGGGPKTHLISLTGLSSDLIWRLYSDAGFNTLLMYCNNSVSNGDEVCPTTSSLKANTIYYLQVQEFDGFSGGFQLDVVPEKKGGGKK